MYKFCCTSHKQILELKPKNILKPNNKKCLERQNHQKLIHLHLHLHNTYLYTRHVEHTTMHMHTRHTYCCCCSSWNFLITLGLWWPCTLCNNTFNYHLQTSQNNLSAIFVYEMCKLIYGYSSLTLLWLDGPTNCQKATVTASPFDISEIFRLFHFYFQ